MTKYALLDEKSSNFMADIVLVFQKHGFSISHEDRHGGFIVEDFSDANVEWILAAMDGRSNPVHHCRPDRLHGLLRYASHRYRMTRSQWWRAKVDAINARIDHDRKSEDEAFEKKKSEMMSTGKASDSKLCVGRAMPATGRRR